METNIGRFTWHIPDFKNKQASTARRSSLVSPIYRFGGHEWIIKLFPQGNSEADYMAVFLELKADQSSESEPIVKFSVQINNHQVPSECIKCHLTNMRRYTAQYSDWGWNTFCSLKAFQDFLDGLDPSDGSITLRLCITSDPKQRFNKFPSGMYLLTGEAFVCDDASDLIVVVCGKEFQCHRKLFPQLNCDRIELSIPACIFGYIHTFVYTGQLFVQAFNGKTVEDALYELIVAADKLGVQQLINSVPINTRNISHVLNAAMATGNTELKDKCVNYVAESYSYQRALVVSTKISVASLLVIIADFVRRHKADLNQTGKFSRNGPEYPKDISEGIYDISMMNMFVVAWTHDNHGEKYIPLLKDQGMDLLFKRYDPTTECDLLFRENSIHDDVMRICNQFVSK